MKARSMVGMVSTGGDLLGADSTSELHISTISDAITLLHYLPEGGEMHRALHVLEMRGSDHDKALGDFAITDHGMAIGEPLADATSLFEVARRRARSGGRPPGRPILRGEDHKESEAG